MSLTNSKLINYARKYKDYQEKRTNGTREQLWDFHWNAGDKNYTIWALLFKDYTGLNFQGQAWCAMFGSDLLVLALMEYENLSQSQAISKAKKLLGGDLPYNCQSFVNSRKNDKRLSHTPKAGSYVIFWTGSKYGHWGLVTGVSNGGFTSIEGNTSGGANKVDPDGGAVVEKYHSNSSKTYFWDLQLAEENINQDYYKINLGKKGLKVLSNLNIRSVPKDGTILGTYKMNEYVFPYEKTFIEGKPWYHTDKGWISAEYVEGWVQEENGLWWYVHKGYTFTVNDWEQIEGVWYYFDNTGYTVKNTWRLINKHWYLFDENCMMVTGWQQKDGEWYYLEEDKNNPYYGACYKTDENGVQTIWEVED